MPHSELFLSDTTFLQPPRRQGPISSPGIPSGRRNMPERKAEVSYFGTSPMDYGNLDLLIAKPYFHNREPTVTQAAVRGDLRDGAYLPLRHNSPDATPEQAGRKRILTTSFQLESGHDEKTHSPSPYETSSGKACQYNRQILAS